MYAAECIARLSQDRPDGIHPIAWLNTKQNPAGMYATDPNWWIGVSSFFRQIRTDHGDKAPLINGMYSVPIQVSYTITSPFGDIRDSSTHTGVDLACPLGTPIYSMSNGIVTSLVSGDSIGGNEVWISGADGRVYTYWHCSHFASIQIGQTIEAGTLIAYVGSTGNSTGPHLHLGVKENGNWIDGLKLLN